MTVHQYILLFSEPGKVQEDALAHWTNWSSAYLQAKQGMVRIYFKEGHPERIDARTALYCLDRARMENRLLINTGMFEAVDAVVDEELELLRENVADEELINSGVYSIRK